MSTCHLCPEEPPDEGILEHLRLMHPAEFGDGPECWPDGGLVVIDETDPTADEIGGGGNDPDIQR